MKLAKFWAKEKGEVLSGDGQRIRVLARGWSNESMEAAREVARDVGRRVAERLTSGGLPSRQYLYGDRPLPEPILREFINGAAGPAAVVTRNAYGSLVLNTRDLMFVDIDRESVPAQSSSSFASGIRSLFGKTPPAPVAMEDPVVAQIRQVAESNRVSARIYKTAAGYRALITSEIFEPGSARSEMLLQQFGSDPLYVRLCRSQQSFRARLSPKPWRCGQTVPPVSFPYITADEQSRFNAWESKYSAAATQYATCHYVTATENSGGISRLDELIRYHDSETRASSTLLLA